MSIDNNTVKVYGWSGTKAPCSCSFLSPKVIEIIKALNVSSVIDIGCGNGALCGILKQQEFDVCGVEYDKGGCKIASQANPEIKFYNLGIYDSPAPIIADYADGFECAVSTEVVEHLFSPQFLPIFASKILRSGGYLIISTPYHGFLKNLMLSLFDHWDKHHTVLWEGGHIKFWSRKTLTQLVEEQGYKVIGFHGVGRCPYLWKSMIVVAQKIN